MRSVGLRRSTLNRVCFFDDARPTRSALVLMLTFLLAAPVHASDSATDPPHDPNSEGLGVGGVALDLGILDPDRSYGQHDVGLGFSVQVVGGRTRWWPLMFGLGAGLLLFGGTTQDGPVTGYVTDDGGFWIGTTREHRSVEIRHAELIVRVEPFWGRVRPFVEGAVGVAALWHASSLRTGFSDEEIVSNDKQRDASVLFGGTLGVEWELWPMWEHLEDSYSLVLTTAVRRWYTGPMERPQYVGNPEEELRTETSREMLAMWIPIVALSISGDSRRPRPAR